MIEPEQHFTDWRSSTGVIFELAEAKRPYGVPAYYRRKGSLVWLGPVRSRHRDFNRLLVLRLMAQSLGLSQAQADLRLMPRLVPTLASTDPFPDAREP